jgi:amino acid transporter
VEAAGYFKVICPPILNGFFMEEQNFKNHTRLIPSFHFGLFTVMLAVIIGAVINFVNCFSSGDGLYSAALLAVISLMLPLIALFARSFALKAQDRAIRAEENLRYFAITGKLLDSRLTIGQIIALRFASNNEFVDLAHRAAEENLAPKEIKNAVKNWKGDYHRV